FDQRWGYGFLISSHYYYDNDGWNLSLLGLIVGAVSGIGLGNSVFIWRKTATPFTSSLFKRRSQNSRATQKSSE
ncbi:MAG TPA: hypothetical protein VIY29_29405, partial [Ktedonobacteraceae bacterium]